MSLALKVLIALLAGMGLGLFVSHGEPAALAAAVRALDPVGTIWVAGIRMTVIPLVVSSLVVGVGGAADPSNIAKIGGRAIGVFVLLLTLAVVVAVVTGPPLLATIHIDPAAAEALRASATQAAAQTVEGAKSLPGVAQWIVDLVPVNPVRAATEGAMLPLIVFSLAFAIALTRVEKDRRNAVLGAAHGIQDASLILVRAVLALAPIGVFALSANVGAKLGASAAGALATYVVLVVGITAGFSVLILYPAAVIIGRVPLRTFARAAFPPQAVAFSSRSSLAALPAMLETSAARLGLDASFAAFFFPLAVTLFRCGAAIGQVIGALFVAKLYSVDLGAGQLVAIAVTTVITTFSIPGIPGGSIIMIVPVLLAAGVPAEGVGMLLGVDTIPDMFRTTTNVTADVATAAILRPRNGPAPAA